MTEVEEEIFPFTWDHQAIYREGKPFFPVIHSLGGKAKGFNAAKITLPCRIEDDLNWKKEMELAKTLVKEGLCILWELDFGLGNTLISLDDEPSFLSLKIGAEHFRKTVAEAFKKESLGLILYRGSLDIADKFVWTDTQEESWKKWLEEHPGGHKSSFCLDSLLHYLRLFAPYLPDYLPLVLCLDASTISSTYQMAELLHKDRWEHFLIAAKGAKIPVSALVWEKGCGSLGYLGDGVFNRNSSHEQVGILFAENASSKEHFEKILAILRERGISYRILYENFATAEWDGLDYIIHPSYELSTKTRRILQGFGAAGGKAVTLTSTGLFNEVLLDEFLEEANRGRGI